MLSVKNVTKRFGGLTAVNNVSLEVRQGEIVGLIGPNGAGKSTFFNVLTGLYKPDEGAVLFDQTPIHTLKPFQISKRGISRTFQNIRLLKEESVLENVKVGMFGLTHTGLWSAILGLGKSRQEEKWVTEKSLEALEIVGLKGYESERADSLSYGNQRRVEIARALVSNPKLLLLDEPIAGMNASEIDEISRLVRNIRDENGTTVVIIEHNVGMVVELCDRIAVLDHGEKIADDIPEKIVANQAVIEAYIGKEEEEEVIGHAAN